MPTYVYKFVDSDETIEIQQSFTDATLTEAVHPISGATLPVKKVFLPVGVTFKGDGFYKTDSRNSKKSSGSSSSGSNSSESAAASNGSDSSSSSTKSESSKSETTKSQSSKSESSKSTPST